MESLVRAASLKKEIWIMKPIDAQHPSEDAIENYLMQRLPSSKSFEVEEHLLICNQCQQAVEEVEDLIGGIKLACLQSEVRPFGTHLPLYSLEAAAGKFGKQQLAIEPEGWVQVPGFRNIRLTPDMFVIHIKGFSMEPDILDGSICAFQAKVVPPYDGKIVLLEKYGEAGGNRYTVKLYRRSAHVECLKVGDAPWLHERITLESRNPDFDSWDIASDGKVNVVGEFLFSF
jgi:hypothetical protein